MKTKRLTENALLTAFALIIFIIELQLPSLSPVPGLKLGLSNIITVYAVFTRRPRDAAQILGVRIVLGTILGGNMSALMYSAAGGLLCYLVMLLLRPVLSSRQIWVASVLGAIAHNTGQILVAVLITQTPVLFAYLPVLTLGGVIAGILTGLCAQYVVLRRDAHA